MNTTIEKNKKEEGISWGISLLFHSLILAYFSFTIITSKLEKVESEGTLVLLGDFEAGVDSEIAEGDLIPNENDAANPPSGEIKNDNIKDINDEESEVVVKKNDAKKSETKKTNPSVNPTTKSNTNTTSNTQKQTEDELNKKKSQFGDLFGKGKGNGGQEGNQGETKGDPNGKVLSGISTGTGRVGGGLSNRGIMQAPVLSENSQKYGRVVVKVCVDKKGKVIESTFTQKGSTTTDSQLVSISEKAAKKYVFASGELDQQCGTITFDFKLN